MDTFDIVAAPGQEFRSLDSQAWVIRLPFPTPEHTGVEFLSKDHLENFLAL